MTTTVPPPAELSPPDPLHDSDWPGSSGPARLSPAAASTAAPLHGRVLRREGAGDAAYHSREKPVCEAPGERSSFQSRAASGDGPELVDLLRLHTPTPDVVIVRVSGTVDRQGAQLLGELTHKQLNRTPHLVIAPGDVAELTRTPRIRSVTNAIDRQRRKWASDAPCGRTAGDG